MMVEIWPKCKLLCLRQTQKICNTCIATFIKCQRPRNYLSCCYCCSCWIFRLAKMPYHLIPPCYPFSSLSLSLSHFSLFSSFLNSIYLSIYHSINWYSIAADPEAAIGFVHKEPYVTANHALTLCSVKMASASAMLQSLQTPFGLRQASPDRNVFSGSPDHAGRLKLSPDNVL